jgi:acetoin utilization deacetylase AcuC-like enzyme
MDAFYSDQFVLPLPEGHRFPMKKYAMLREAIAVNLPQVCLREAPAASDSELAWVHTADYVDSLCAGTIEAAAMREIGFPWSTLMVERARRSVGATVAAVHQALQTGIAANLAGGTHHAYASKGGGFCVFNDIAVAARVAQWQWTQQHCASLQVAVIDLDVHQGNGTAHIFQTDPTVFTLSLHGEKNFPFRKEVSDLDVGLPDGCQDDAYMDALDQSLEQLERRFEPGLVIYLAGADPYAGDRLGRLNLSAKGLQERDSRVFEWCSAKGLPVAFVMGGGYCSRIEETVEIQLNTYRVACQVWDRQRLEPGSASWSAPVREKNHTAHI